MPGRERCHAPVGSQQRGGPASWAAGHWGIRVPDSEVISHVKQTFGGGKQFDIERVEDFLKRRSRLDLPSYEKTVREMLQRR